MKPTLGRIVLYRSGTGLVSPAIVTQVNSETSLNLTVFPGLDCPQIRAYVHLGEPEQKGECWYWPPREATP